MDHVRGLAMADPSLSDEQRAEIDREWQDAFGALFDGCKHTITTPQYECIMSSTTLDQLARCEEIHAKDTP